MNTPAPDSVASRSAAGRSLNGHYNEATGSTPRVQVTKSQPRTRFGSTATRLFEDPWTLNRMLRLQLLQLASLKIWRAAFLEGIYTGMWVLGSTMIITEAANWGTNLPGRTFLVIAFLHTVMFTLYIQSVTTTSTSNVNGLPAISPTFPSLNPSVTFMLMLRGTQSPVSGLLCMVMQCVGAILACLCGKELIPQDRVDRFMLGGCYGRRTILATDGTSTVVGLSDHKYLLAEFVFAFTFLYVTALLTHPKQLRVLGVNMVVFLISLNIGFITYLSASLRYGYGGSSFNPARCLGAAVAYGQPLWDRLWPAVVAPYVAAFAVVFLFATMPPDHVEVYETRKDVISEIRRWTKSKRPEPSSQNDYSELPENSTLYEVPSGGRLFSNSPETPDLPTPLEPSQTV